MSHVGAINSVGGDTRQNLQRIEKNVYLLKKAALFVVFLWDFSDIELNAHVHVRLSELHILVFVY